VRPHLTHTLHPQELERYLWEDEPARANLTLQGMLKTCSHGNAWLNRGTSAVAALQLPQLPQQPTGVAAASFE
jgi:hypothetical protein